MDVGASDDIVDVICHAIKNRKPIFQKDFQSHAQTLKQCLEII